MSPPRNSKGPKGPVAADGEPLLRPLSPRSVIASLLLGMHPPRLSSARLVQWCAVFGVSVPWSG